jgi:Coenzyme Q (ubiquinone) biosynthesis protein Coq4
MLLWLQQALFSLVSNPTFIQQAMIAIQVPTRANAVAAVGELTGRHHLQHLFRKMQRDPLGQEILRQRLIVSKGTIPIDCLTYSSATPIRERIKHRI